MLGLALIGLQAGELETSGAVDLPGDLDRGLTRLDAATPRSDVDLDQAFDRDPVFLCRGRQIVDVGQIIDANQHADAGRQRRKTLDLLGRDDFVRDENVAHVRRSPLPRLR